MAEKQTDVWSLMGLDEGGLPIHLPMAVTRDGQGPADASDAVKLVCWCQSKACPVTRALEEARDLGAKGGGWGAVIQNLTTAEAERTRERNLLAQAMWDARRELGFDCDDNDSPGASIAGMGYEWFARSHVEEAKEVRKDYDDLLDEWNEVKP